MTITTPWRRMILHFSQMGLTLGLTFTSCSSASLVPVRDTTPREVIGGELDLDPVPREDPDVVHPHLSGDVRQDLVAVFELHPEHRVREWLDDRPLHEDRIVFGFCQGDPPTLSVFPRRERPQAARARPGSISGNRALGEAVRWIPRSRGASGPPDRDRSRRSC